MSIIKMPAETAAADDALHLMTTSEVATLLRCSAKTISRRVHAGQLPAIKDGCRFLFDAEVIRAQLMANMVRPKTPHANCFSSDGSNRDV